MSHDLLQKRVWQSDQINVQASTGDKATFTAIKPVDIYRWGLATDALLDVGAGGTLALDHRPTAGSDTDRTEVDVLSLTADVVAGKVVARLLVLDDPTGETAEDGTTRFVSPEGPFQVDPGEQLVFEVTNVFDTAGTGIAFLEYVEHDMAGTRIEADVVETEAEAV